MKHLLAILVEGKPLTTEQTVEAFTLIMDGEASGPQIGAMLAMMQQRGPTVEEITGAATVMRQKVASVAVPNGLTVIDTCGTGGDHSGTFNISTAAALVAAAAGRPGNVAVAKHGNRSVTSKSGSSQVLEALGMKLKVNSETLSRCLDDAGICFCFAPAHHPAMKHVMPARLDLGFRTIFNVLGPLTNPAGAARQVMGVFDNRLTEPIAHVLLNLGSIHAMVVRGRAGEGGMDELVTTGPTQISEVRDGAVTTWELDATELGLPRADVNALKVDSPEASAAVIRAVVEGKAGPARDIVCLNAAAALVVAGLAGDLQAGLEQASHAIDSGAAKKMLDALVKVTQADPTPVD